MSDIVTETLSLTLEWRVGTGGWSMADGEQTWHDAVITKPEKAAGQVRDITKRRDGSLLIGPDKRADG